MVDSTANVDNRVTCGGPTRHDVSRGNRTLQLTQASSPARGRDSTHEGRSLRRYGMRGRLLRSALEEDKSAVGGMCREDREGPCRHYMRRPLGITWRPQRHYMRCFRGVRSTPLSSTASRVQTFSSVAHRKKLGRFPVDFGRLTPALSIRRTNASRERNFSSIWCSVGRAHCSLTGGAGKYTSVRPTLGGCSIAIGGRRRRFVRPGQLPSCIGPGTGPHPPATCLEITRAFTNNGKGSRATRR
jgi:hypothetical protein